MNTTDTNASARPSGNPGDEAAPGTPQTGENTCPACAGRGKRADSTPCPECGGTGVVIVNVGDA